MKKVIAIVAILCIFLNLCGCDEYASSQTKNETNKNSQISFIDDLGNKLNIAPPRRVVALTGSFAHIWCLAGGADVLVAAAADTWTSFDLGLSEKVINIGSVKEPSLEKILSAEPDLILASCNTEANIEMKDIFEKAGIPTAYFDIQHISDYLNMLDICTSLTENKENYEEFGLAVKKQVDVALERVDGRAPKILCMRATGSSCKVKSSNDFLLGEMLRDLGCFNVADNDKTLLEELSLEAILKADPEYIFVVLQGSDPTSARETLEKTLLANPAWKQLSAVKEGKFYTLEHELYNLKPNDRWGDAYEKLADILYPHK